MSLAEEKHKSSTSYLMPFEKMHGLGNDFVVVNAAHLPEQTNTVYEVELAKRICNRNRGIGADGLIIIDQSKNLGETSRSWRFYNSDGSIAEMCGNGIRCAALYIYEHGLSFDEESFSIETLVGNIGVELQADNMVRVDMGEPRSIENNLSLSVDNEIFNYDFISMGNPHAVSFYDCNDIELRAKSQLGSKIERHPNFPNKTNVEFARITGTNSIELIVWERGCGFTEACGTGACATAISAIEKSLMEKDQDILVHLPGGTLVIRWDSITNHVYMTGPAELVCMGYYNA